MTVSLITVKIEFHTVVIFMILMNLIYFIVFFKILLFWCRPD